MNKTIYIRDEDIGVWDKARELAGEKLSPVIIAALKRFVSENEGVARGFERIVVQYADSANHNIPRAKAFIGRWIIPPEEDFSRIVHDEFGSTKTFAAVAITAKTRVVVYSRTEYEGTETESFDVFDSLELAAAKGHSNSAIICAAMERQGVPIEDLDI